MKGVSLGCTPVPSPAVLRFLRIQADSLSFLASQKRTCWDQTRRSQDTNSREGTSCRESSEGIAAMRLGGGGGGGVHAQSSRIKSRVAYSFASHSPCNIGSSPGFQARHISSSSAQGWSRPWNRIRQKPAGPLQPNDLPAPSLLDDNASLSRIVKPTNELQLRCTEFDELGRVTLVNGAFKKSELIAKVRHMCLEMQSDQHQLTV